MTETLVDVSRAHKKYGQISALDGVSFTAQSGTIVGLIGENGCGKSTLLKAIAGLVALDSGSITVAGHPIGVDSKLAVSYLPDRSALPARGRIRDCIRSFHEFHPDFDADRARDLVTELGVYESRRLNELSKGQQEKAHIALTMARRSRVYLLDEPISGVDPLTREATLRVVIESLEPESLLLITTHMVQDVEMIVDRALLMRRGRIVDDVLPEELRDTAGESLVDRLRKVYSR